MRTKARLVKKDALPKPVPEPAAKTLARRGGPAVDPRAVFNALFTKK
jgi:hypothetical protein